MEDVEDGDTEGPALSLQPDELPAALVRICRSPRNDGVLDARLLGFLLDPDPACVRTDVDGDRWVARNPTELGERFGAGRKEIERSVARLVGHGFVRLGVDADGTGWLAPATAAVVAAIAGRD